MTRIPIDYNRYTQEELLDMPYKTAIKGLTEKSQKFCECYIEGHNRKMAMMKAGFTETGSNYSYRLLKNENVQRYICWLKARVLNDHLLTASDVIDAWIRIAFADMTDFVDILPHSIKLKPADKIDGQLVKAIKTGKDGVSIELHDKMKALDNLARYIDDMPKDWKQKLEERRAQLLEEEFELKKRMAELDAPEKEDDGFMEALKASATAVWDNEE